MNSYAHETWLSIVRKKGLIAAIGYLHIDCRDSLSYTVFCKTPADKKIEDTIYNGVGYLEG